MEGGSASKKKIFFKKPFAEDIYKQHKQQDGRGVLLQYNCFLREDRFSTGQNRRIYTENKGRNIEPESLAFIYKNTVACITFAGIIFPEVKETIALHGQQDNESIL